MLKELLSIFRDETVPLAAVAQNFRSMIDLTLDSTLKAGAAVFGEGMSAAERTALYRQDVEVNQLERTIRKRLAAHLAIAGSNVDVPYCLIMMSLVKDVERLGDYAKNLVDLQDLLRQPLERDALFDELQEIRNGSEEIFRAAAAVFQESDRESAIRHTAAGRDIMRRCEALVHRAVDATYSPSQAVVVALGGRFYKRICGHILNILSSVVMPLHKIDYYDEDEITRSD